LNIHLTPQQSRIF